MGASGKSGDLFGNPTLSFADHYPIIGLDCGQRSQLVVTTSHISFSRYPMPKSSRESR
jgi:hypothetical protein